MISNLRRLLGDDWESRRRRRISLLRPIAALRDLAGLLIPIGIAIAIVGQGPAIDFLNATRVPALWTVVADRIEQALPWLAGRLPRHPLIFAIIIPYAAALWRSRDLATQIHDRYFGEFNDALLKPVRDPARDPLWQPAGTFLRFLAPREGRNGAREQAWSALETLTDPADVGHGATRLPWSKPEVPVRFRWMLLVGRPGSGKSRMVTEFLRKKARRDIVRDQSGFRDRMRVRLLRAGAWARFAIWFLKRRPDDPWDAGQVVGMPDVATLQSWQPARPTLIWLDDPLPGEAAAWIDVLARLRDGWMHPVRLVIVNQSVPAELQLVRNAQTNAWHDNRPRIPMNVSILSASARFDAQDIRAAVGQFAGTDRARTAALAQLYRDDGVRHVLAQTKGNPLLVELMLDWVARGKPINDATREALLTDRARRVLAALKEAGVAELDSLAALACATLVGPRALRKPIADAVTRLPSGDVLAAAVPADADFDRLGELPAIRPQMIGDATAGLILTETLPAEYRLPLLLQAAFEASPGGWLRAVERIGGSGTRFAAALNAFRPTIAAEDHAARRALAWAKLSQALHGYRPAPEVWREVQPLLDEAQDPRALRDDLWSDFLAAWAADKPKRAAMIANRASSLTTGQPLDEAWEATADDDDLVDPRHRCMWGTPLLLIGAALQGHGEEGPVSGDRLSEALAVITELVNEVATTGPKQWSKDDVAHLARTTAWLFVPTMAAEPQSDTVALLQLSHAFTGATHNLQQILRRGLLWRWSAQSGERRAVRRCRVSTALAVEPSEALELVDRLDSIIAANAGWARDREMQLERATARVDLARLLRESEPCCRKAVAEVDAIVAADSAWAQDREMQLQRAVAWGCLADARTASEPACREATEQVEAIVSSNAAWARDRDMQLARLLAWGHLADARQGSEAACRAAVEQVDAIVAGNPGWANDYDMQCLRAVAWRHLARAVRESEPACREVVAQVDAVVAADAAWAYDYGMQRQRARAWLHLAYARRGCEEASREAVEQLDAIVAGNPDWAHDREMQLERAVAWRRLAYVRKESGPGCRAAVEQVDAIVAAHPGWAYDYDMQCQRAEARRPLAYALRNSSQSCREVVEQIDAIVASDPAWAKDLEMQRERAQAWALLVGAVEDSEPACRAIVEQVDAIAAANPDWAYDRLLQWARADARCHLSAVLQNSPIACRETVEQLDVIVAANAGWAHDREMQHRRAEAWLVLAYASRSDPELFQASLTTLRHIVAPWGPRALPPYRHDAQICGLLAEALGFRPNPAGATALGSSAQPGQTPPAQSITVNVNPQTKGEAG